MSEEAFLQEWRNAAYNCFSSGHKFCREVCPVMQVTRDERHSPTAFHANVVALEKGLLSVEDVAHRLVLTAAGSPDVHDVVDRPGLRDDPRFSTYPARLAHFDELVTELEAALTDRR